MAGNHSPERVLGEARHPSRRDAKASGRDSYVELTTANVDIEAACLLEALEIRRGQPDHRFAERD
jgi:hypothetical protein